MMVWPGSRTSAPSSMARAAARSKGRAIYCGDAHRDAPELAQAHAAENRTGRTTCLFGMSGERRILRRGCDE